MEYRYWCLRHQYNQAYETYFTLLKEIMENCIILEAFRRGVNWYKTVLYNLT